MKQLFLIMAILFFGLFFVGCEAETVVDAEQDVVVPLTVDTLTTPDTNSEPIYFSFSKGDTISIADPENSTEWDIAMQRTTVWVNSGTSGPGVGGAAWIEGANFEDVKQLPDPIDFAIDDTLSTTGSAFAIPTGTGNGWYNYTFGPNHWILAIEDRVFFIRTADGNYAKVKFLSYYSNGKPPEEPLQTDSGYYTFTYFYQPNGTGVFED
ncbi:MAG: HmuY family protein [Calditrichota bacterium]